MFKRTFALLFIISMWAVFKLQAGTGIHGAKTITSTNQILNEFTSLTGDAVSGSLTINVASSALNANGRFPGNLTSGELIMIIQMQGASMNTASATASSWGAITTYNNAGKYEFNEVLSVPNATTIAFVNPLLNSYTVTGNVQIIRVPRYTNLVVTGSGSLTAPSWNGNTGGVISIEVSGNVLINGTIDVTGLGFRGGIVDSTANNNHVIYASVLKGDGAEKGESIGGNKINYDLLGGRYGRGAPANGGGGGNAHNAGGGGGANANNGLTYNGQGVPDTITDPNWKIAWDLEGGNFHLNNSSGGGRGGYTYSMKAKDPLVVAPGNTSWNGDDRSNVGGLGGRPLNNSGNRIFFGGGGGAGDNNNNSGGGGGNGGGIVYLNIGGVLNGSGIINANGSDGITSTANDAAGGGGGGGTVVISTVSSPPSGISVNAKGGHGGNQIRIANSSGEAEGPGGGGGGGYVAISIPNTLITNISGGAYGTTNTPTMISFLPNGATSGAGGSTGIPAGSGSTLPVMLIEFKARLLGHAVELSWTTASEINNDHFTVDKSTDGINYSSIGIVRGNGTTTIMHHYSLTDKNPIESKNYYRLHQSDYDGNETNYNPIVIDFPIHMVICPNPAVDIIVLKTNRSLSGLKYIIRNSLCQITSEGRIEEQQTTIFLTGLEAGVYFLEVGESVMEKFVISK